MTKSKTTRRALFFSMTAILLCFVMLMGTTFAWFTDSASTGVSVIQAGELKIALYDGENPLTGPLKWVRADGTEITYWEPGGTYKLQPVTIKNVGNLAVKYQILLTGIGGTEGLDGVIEWTITVDEQTQDLSTFTGKLGTTDNDNSAVLSISGKLRDGTGNAYQGQIISDIAITVLATQDTVEFDSTRQDYDADAAFPVSTAEEAVTALTTTGIVTLTDTFTMPEIVYAATPEISISAVDAAEPVTIYTPQVKDEEHVILYYDASKLRDYDEYTANLSNVILENSAGGASSVQTFCYSGKTFNINGGTFKTYSGQNNGAIHDMYSSNCTINVSDATFIVGKSSSTQYATIVALEESTNMTVNFTNCTFMLEDGGTVTEIEDIANCEYLSRLFYGFDTSGSTLTVDGVTIIGQ